MDNAKTDAQQMADEYAQDAYDNHFSERRGVWHLEGTNCLVVYNNFPYSVDASIRPREMDRLEQRLKASGIDVLARGEGGELLEDGQQKHTVSMLLNCKPERMEEISAIIEDEAGKSLKEIDALVAARSESAK